MPLAVSQSCNTSALEKLSQSTVFVLSALTVIGFEAKSVLNVFQWILVLHEKISPSLCIEA